MIVKRARWGVSALVAVVVAVPAVGAFATVMDAGQRAGALTQVGPTTDFGFPAWYRDSNNVRLEPCVTLDDPYCPVLADEVPNPEEPVSYPDNFPGEFFYQLAGAELTVQGVDLGIGLDLEGAFAADEVTPGDEMVFGRIRIRAKDLPDGRTWRITHPYGVDQFTTSGGTGINMTQDIGITPGVFGGALASRVGPFLKWDPDVAPAAPAGYTGNPGVDHKVVGSPYGTNFVKVEQKNADGSWSTLAQTDLFSVQGRYATNSGLDVDRASYALQEDGRGTIDVFATSEIGQSIQASADAGLGYASTTLRGEAGRYFGRLPVTAGVPEAAQIEIVNAGDKPVARKTVRLSDLVTIGSATYQIGDIDDPDDNKLVVTASSSDAANDPVLTVKGFGPLVNGTATFTGVTAPPSSVTVTSARGGSATVATSVGGEAFAAIRPVAAFAAPDEVSVGQTVLLDATASSGDITSYQWSQTSQTSVATTGMGTSTLSWTPTDPGIYEFRLVVSGPGGDSLPVTRSVTVTAAAALTAYAGPDQTVQRGKIVTLDAGGTAGHASLRWTQVSGPPVTLSSTTALHPTFTYSLMPLPNAAVGNLNPGYVRHNEPLTFRLTATAPDGTTTAVDDVVVSPTAESIGGVTARYRTRGEWRVSGTTSILAGQRVAVVLGPNATGRTIGTATVDAAGAFSIRGNGTPDPRTAPAQSQVTVVSATGGVVTAGLTVTG
jgi:hypothetical protein